jgi:tetratricopeptide (TPR) repeat protein
VTERPAPVTVLALDDLEEIPAAGVRWRPLRRRLGITGFGVNAYSADAGEQVIEEHDERETGDEEMYVVLRGAARFGLGDEERDAAAGTVVVYADPGLRRGAVALEDGTLVMAVGGRPGSHPPSAWESRLAAEGPASRGDFAAAAEMVRATLADHPDDAKAHYDLARHLARAGMPEEALAHLIRACATLPEAAHRAAEDADLDDVRRLPGFPR